MTVSKPDPLPYGPTISPDIFRPAQAYRSPKPAPPPDGDVPLREGAVVLYEFAQRSRLRDERHRRAAPMIARAGVL